MNLTLLLSVAGALIAGAVVGLKVIAPLTANKVDDKVLERLEAIEKVLSQLKA